jgi:hypothetical protein
MGIIKSSIYAKNWTIFCCEGAIYSIARVVLGGAL